VKIGRPNYWRHTWHKSEAAAEFGLEFAHWDAFCPSCKRPMKVELISKTEVSALRTESKSKGKYAYVIALWGCSKEYVIGAMVLGQSLRQTGTKHDLVCMHTADVPEGFIRLLSLVWKCEVIEHVDYAVERLSFSDQCLRFGKVFTKLRVFGLVEYEKVVMMDIDMLVLQSIDDLFELPAPAAMRRGSVNEGYNTYHGCDLDGSCFFQGRNSDERLSWGQGTGINAGVMLLEPSLETLERMLEEINDASHPAHIKGNGPEQDYLSRYFADAPWKHIAVAYNYQLHQMFHSLRPKHVHWADRMKYLDEGKIKVIHYSGEPYAKPWCRVFDEELWPDRGHDEAFLLKIALAYRSYRLWILRDPYTWDSVNDDDENAAYTLGEDGFVYEKESNFTQRAEVPKYAAEGTMRVLRHSMVAWLDTFTRLETETGLNLVAELQQVLLGAPSDDAEEPTTATAAAAGESPAVANAPDTTAVEVSSARPPVGGREAAKPYMKYINRNGWAREVPTLKGDAETNEGLVKVTVTCCARPQAQFVYFSFGASPQDVHLELTADAQFKGVVGQAMGQEPRAFNMQSEFDERVNALGIWLDAVDNGKVVVLAVLGLQGSELEAVLEMLANMEIPQGPVDDDITVLAIAGFKDDVRPWWRTQASVDVAYVSIAAVQAASRS